MGVFKNMFIVHILSIHFLFKNKCEECVKSWIGAIVLLFYHSFCPFVFSVEKVRRLERKVRYRGSAGSD